MEKKNRPLQAANSDIRVSDVTPVTGSFKPSGLFPPALQK